MNKIPNLDVLLVKAREHKTKYTENIEDVRIGYIDALLQKKDINTQILDFAFSQNDWTKNSYELIDIVRFATPKVIIFFIDKHPTNSPAYTLELLDTLTSNVDLNLSHITLYGNTQIDYAEFFEHNINSVILGEEESALSLVFSVLNNNFPQQTNGIAYRSANSQIQICKAELNCNNLDDLPFPTRYAFEKVSNKQYAASILSSRGCFGKCSYCYLRSKEKYFSHYQWRERSVENVVDEIEQLYKIGVTEFFFVDDEFLPIGNKGIIRAREFSNEIIKRNLSINYSIYCRADCLSEEIVQSLKESGLYCVFLGVESFSQSVLDRYNKNLSVEMNIAAISLLKKYDIHIRLGLIMFDMNTTLEELKSTIETLKLVSESKSELLFQSMFFSNALIPLNDTPSFNISCNEFLEINPLMQENYMRRSRSGKKQYVFLDSKISAIYTCVGAMSEKLLSKCIEEENYFFTHGFSERRMNWFCNLTRFAICLLSVIYENITSGMSIEVCNKIVEKEINAFYSKIAA